jgi:glyoxylase-like metal-dependent hydrolase (beta-lactamase superfamily II)
VERIPGANPFNLFLKSVDGARHARLPTAKGENPMQVAPGIHRIEAPLGERFVAMHLLVGDEAALLFDTGMDRMPYDYILPYLDQIGLSPAKIRYVLTSHADFDHTAGNASMKEIAPDALFLCHALDQAMVEDVETLIRDRYSEFEVDHGIGDSDESKQSIREQSRHTPVDLALRGGETIRLGADWQVEVLHTPGHSRGHLTIWDARSATLIICDATLYNAVLFKNGKSAFPPTYRYVDSYVASMNRLAAIPAQTMLTSHYPVYRGVQIAEFMAESRAYVDRVDQTLLHALADGEPRTMRELIDQTNRSLGEWPEAAGIYLCHPFAGHLERLVQYGVLATGRRDGLLTYRLTK